MMCVGFDLLRARRVQLHTWGLHCVEADRSEARQRGISISNKADASDAGEQ